MPKSAKSIIKGDIKQAADAGTTRTACTGNLGVHEIRERKKKKSALRKHAYSNILKISPPKNWKFSGKIFFFFFFFMLLLKT